MVTTADPVTAHFGGEPLAAFTEVGWSLTSGVQPHQRVFEFERTRAEFILEQSKDPTFLEMVTDEGTLTVDNLFILGEAPTSLPQTKGVIASDSRFRWPYKWIFKRYNIRRKTGERRRVDAGNLREDFDLDVDDIFYAPWSLLAESFPWSAQGIIRDILSILEPNNFELRIGVRAKSQQVTVENFELDDSGEQALSRALSLIPGAQVFVDRRGKVIVYDSLDGAEGDLPGVPRTIVGDGRIRLITNKETAPQKVRVYFTPEYEIRFDHPVSQPSSSTRGRVDDRVMDNVLDLPDVRLTITSEGRTREVITGTWVTFDEVLPAWNLERGNFPEEINEEFIRKAFKIPQLVHLFGFLDLRAITGTDTDIRNWAARWSKIKSHFRQTYRLPRSWVQRYLTVRASRVSVIDPESGHRAPSPVYSDYSVVVSNQKVPDPDLIRTLLGANVDGYPGRGGNLSADNADARVAPAVVSVIDEEQGIFRVDFRTDPLGIFNTIFPSKITNFPVANMDFGANPLQPRGWEIRSELQSDEDLPQLELWATDGSDGVAVILTIIPASPNSLEQLHVEDVTPEEAQSFVSGNIIGAQGPVMEIHVGPGIETARFAWDDDERRNIEQKLFGRVFGVDLTNLMVNPEEVRGIAIATAARIYSGFADRPIGSTSIKMIPELEPRGALRNVVHALSTEGAATTRMDVTPERPGLDLFSLLPASVRNVIQRIAQRHDNVGGS